MQAIFFRNLWVQSLVFLGKGKTVNPFLFKTIEPYMQYVHVLIILFFVQKSGSLNLTVS